MDCIDVKVDEHVVQEENKSTKYNIDEPTIISDENDEVTIE